MACLISGLISSFVFSKILDKSKNQHKTMIMMLHIITIGSLISFIAFLILMRPNSFITVTVLISLVGIFMVPIMPIGYYAAVELSKPMSEPMSSGIIMVFAEFIGVALTYLISYLSDQRSTGNSNEEGSGAKGVRLFLMITIGITILASATLFFVRAPG